MQDIGKTSNFLRAINKYAAEQRKEIKTRAEEFRKYELQKAEAEVLRDAYFLIQREMAQMKKNIANEVSKLELEKRKEIFAKRQNIMDEVLKKARNKILDFTNTQEYVEHLKKYANSISKILKKSGTILYVCARDEKFKDMIREAYGKICVVKVDEKIKVGGIRAINSVMALVVDETLDAKLEKQKSWFEENSKLNIF